MIPAPRGGVGRIPVRRCCTGMQRHRCSACNCGLHGNARTRRHVRGHEARGSGVRRRPPASRPRQGEVAPGSNGREIGPNRGGELGAKGPFGTRFSGVSRPVSLGVFPCFSPAAREKVTHFGPFFCLRDGSTTTGRSARGPLTGPSGVSSGRGVKALTLRLTPGLSALLAARRRQGLRTVRFRVICRSFCTPRRNSLAPQALARRLLSIWNRPAIAGHALTPKRSDTHGVLPCTFSAITSAAWPTPRI